jgi:hypothetical protein
MARTKGAKNKPKDETTSEAVEVVRTEEKPQIEEAPQVEEKPQIKIIEKIIEKEPIPDKPLRKPRKPAKKPVLQLEQIQEPVNTKGISKKYVALGLIGVGIVLAYFYKDKILDKYVSWKSNRLMDQISKEGIESVVINGQEGA